MLRSSHSLQWIAILALCLELSACQTAAPAITSAPSVPKIFKRMVIIILENKSLKDVISNEYFAGLARRGVQLTEYHGLARPSQPNYIALLAGEPLVADNKPHNLKQANLIDLLENGGVSWKAYLGSYPGECFAGETAQDESGGIYARKHNPFISFNDVRDDPRRCAKIVGVSQVETDLASDSLPAVSFLVPNLNDDMHDQPVAYGANWLQTFLEPKLTDPRFVSDTLVVITFDEPNAADPNVTQSVMYTVLLGPLVAGGTTDATPYNHYSLLRTIEDNYSLGSLGKNDLSATPLASCNFGGGCSP